MQSSFLDTFKKAVEPVTGAEVGKGKKETRVSERCDRSLRLKTCDKRAFVSSHSGSLQSFNSEK